MPNIGGVFDLSLSKLDIERENDCQIAELDAPDSDLAVHRILQEGCAIALLDHGILENGPQPAYSDDGRYAILLDGELTNREALCAELGISAGFPPSPAPKLCAELYARFGAKAFDSLIGLFVLVIYDTLEKRLVIVNDQFGFRPLFYRCVGHRLLIGSELKAITALDPDKGVDELGLFELFSFGSHVMDRTWLKGCRKLMPGTVMEQDAGGFKEWRYWRYAYSEESPTLDQETYFTGYRYLMDRAVERCMSGSKRKSIFLSGGYDSRVVAASIRARHLPVPAYTFGESDSRDVRFAAELAARLNLTHSILHDDGPYLARYATPIVHRTEGMLPFAATTSMRFHDRLRKETDIILVGLLAEFGGSHTWPRLLLARTRRQAIEAIFAKLVLSRQAVVRRLFRPEFYDRNYSAMKGAFRQSFEEIPNEHPLNVADAWNFTYLQPRSSFQAPSADRHHFEIRAPHMDLELVRFLLTIPPFARIEQRVYKKMIAYGYPQIRSVPCTNSGKPVNPHFVREYAGMVLNLAGRRLMWPVRKAFGPGRSLGREFVDLHQKLRAEPALADELLSMLEDGTLPSAVFDHNAIRRLVNEQFTLGRDHALLLSLVLSWGLASRKLLYGLDR